MSYIARQMYMMLLTLMWQLQLITLILIMVMLSRITNTASGSDDLPFCLYRECATELLHVLSKLINFSINKGEVPKAWKQAIITPVPKSAPAVSVSDWRPISVTTVLSRIVERLVVRDFISPFIPSQSMIDQYAYKATGSTTCAIINITETVGRMLENMSLCLLSVTWFFKGFWYSRPSNTTDETWHLPYAW